MRSASLGLDERPDRRKASPTRLHAGGNGQGEAAAQGNPAEEGPVAIGAAGIFQQNVRGKYEDLHDDFGCIDVGRKRLHK